MLILPPSDLRLQRYSCSKLVHLERPNKGYARGIQSVPGRHARIPGRRDEDEDLDVLRRPRSAGLVVHWRQQSCVDQSGKVLGSHGWQSCERESIAGMGLH